MAICVIVFVMVQNVHDAILKFVLVSFTVLHAPVNVSFDAGRLVTQLRMPRLIFCYLSAATYLLQVFCYVFCCMPCVICTVRAWSVVINPFVDTGVPVVTVHTDMHPSPVFRRIQVIVHSLSAGQFMSLSMLVLVP